MATNNNKQVKADSLKQAIFTYLNKYGKTKQKKSFINVALSGNKTLLGYIFAMIYDVLDMDNTVSNAPMFLYLCGMYSSKAKNTVTSDTLDCFDYDTDKNNNCIAKSLKIDKVHITLTNGIQYYKGIATDSVINKFKHTPTKSADKKYKNVWITAIQVIADYKGIKAKDIIDALHKRYVKNDCIKDIKLCDIKTA